MANHLAINPDELKGDLPRIVAGIMDALGGQENYGHTMVADVNRIRNNSGLTEEKQERMILSYHRLFMNMVGKKDQYELDTSEFANLSEQELKVMLRQSALESLAVDESFRMEVLKVLEREDPDRVRQLLGIDVIDSPKLSQSETSK